MFHQKSIVYAFFRLPWHHLIISLLLVSKVKLHRISITVIYNVICNTTKAPHTLLRFANAFPAHNRWLLFPVIFISLLIVSYGAEANDNNVTCVGLIIDVNTNIGKEEIIAKEILAEKMPLQFKDSQTVSIFQGLHFWLKTFLTLPHSQWKSILYVPFFFVEWKKGSLRCGLIDPMPRDSNE